MRKGTAEEMEQRQSTRLEKTLPVKFQLPRTPGQIGIFEALSRNISEGGIFVETDLVQDDVSGLGKELTLHLEIELLGRGRRIKPRGEIVWMSKRSRTPQKKRNGIGIRFIQITAQEKRAISIFISNQMLGQSELLEREISLISREHKLTDKQRRNLEILDTIRKNRLISRAEISKHTNINIVTVSNYIDTYLKKGLVFERGLDISTGGRRPELVEINPQYGYVLGVDLGPLNKKVASMQVVATDFTTRLLSQAKGKREDDNIEESLDVLKELIAEALAGEQVDKKKVRGIGVGVAGIMDKFGGTMRNPATGTTFANYVTIKKAIEDEFGLPVFIENSASCALFAERWTGVSSEVTSADNILYIFSEHQCAIMLKGELYTGLSKSAGQLNFTLPRNHSPDNTDYCWLNHSDCVLRSSIGDLSKAAESQETLVFSGNKLGAKVAFLVNVFNPQVVIVGRNLSQLGDTFLDAIRRTVNRWSFRESANLVRIIPASLGEEAPALGAASLVIEAVFANI
ncbi:MAG: ROK family protein [Candidatus Omnitrophica bacterium]|nr:ROK family protein [Candidatus Omnitrophota bacterium]